MGNKKFTISLSSGDLVYDSFCPCPNFRVITGNYGDAFFDHPLSTSFDGVVKKMLTNCCKGKITGRGLEKLIKSVRLKK